LKSAISAISTYLYNAFAVHRIPNGLEDAGVATLRARNLEKFLLQLNASQSQGVPVGPLPSAIVAELCMNDVDTLLLKKGAPHVRFVDDFRVFCKTRGEAIQILHDLTEYLHTTHPRGIKDPDRNGPEVCRERTT
jgi:hypothetical protein